MLGRGVKRKWSCLEELEAGTLRPPPPPPSKEHKAEKAAAEEEDGFSLTERVIVEEEEREAGSSSSRQQLRQVVLGLCVQKLQKGMELSLRRSVLLVNTLRKIQTEIHYDHHKDDDTQKASAESPGSSEVLIPEPRPLIPQPPHHCHPLEPCHHRNVDDRMALTCPGCSQVEEEEENVDSLSLSPPVSPEFPLQEGNDFNSTEQQKLPNASFTSFSDAVSAMGYLGDLALDNIFDDIDTSMYETASDTGSPGSFWPGNVSFWTDEDVKMLRSGSAGSLQNCLMDFNELDHIMEILVKS